MTALYGEAGGKLPPVERALPSPDAASRARGFSGLRAALGELIATGPTGTNVADPVVALAG